MFEIYLVLINAATLILFWTDKRRARYGGRRIAEKHLFLAALAGGTVGALAGMRLFHHKTLQRRFAVGLPLILLGQILAGVVLWGSGPA